MSLRGSASALSEVYDVALLDLDGVVYIGHRPVPGAVGALDKARAGGMRLAFVSGGRLVSRDPDLSF